MEKRYFCQISFCSAIEKHGRRVAVVMSARECQQTKLARLQAKLAVGEEQLNKGEAVAGEVSGKMEVLLS
ncbi:MAG: hypothetical protein BGO99_10560 [Nitrosospira sp. 56-18]|nr:MAG: hypothetical protein BGO99_10560 [Nitrosospira sp. 56-18]